MNGDDFMILIEKFKENDINLLERWKKIHEVESNINLSIFTRNDKKHWVEKINKCSDCKYFIINNGGIKIGIININHMDNEGCILEYYIGDVHFRGRNLTEAILWNVYNYIFDDLRMKYVVTNLIENDKRNINTHLNMGCEIKGRFKEGKYKNEKIKDVIYVLMKKEKWNNIKGEFDYKETLIEKI